MKNFLFVLLVALVGCGEHGDSVTMQDSKLSKKSSDVPVLDIQEFEKFEVPEGAYNLGIGRYLRLFEKKRILYALVAIPTGSFPNERMEVDQPGTRRSWARDQLNKYFNLDWQDDETVHLNKFTLLYFKIPTPAK